MKASFLDFLRRAGEVEPSVLRDAARLWRRWKKTGRPPASWTIRWNDRALSLFSEAVGLDVMRWVQNGGRVVDLAALCNKIGDAQAVFAALSAFTQPDCASPVSEALSAQVRALHSQAVSERSRRWLSRLLANPDGPTHFGEVNEIASVARALEVLEQLSGKEIHCSDLGSRAGASSKYFRPGAPGRRLLADALIAVNGGGAVTDQAREAALEAAGVRLSPTAYAVLAAGPFSVGVPPLDFPRVLSERNEAVLLSLQNLASARLLETCDGVLTIENEASLLSAMKEKLHSRRLLVLTGGFPNRAVLRLLGQVMPRAGSWFHWGDTDLAGIRIARMLESRLGRTPELFRSTPSEVRRLKGRLIPLPSEARREMASDLKEFPATLGSEVLRADLAEGGWLEQEAWEAAAASAD